MIYSDLELLHEVAGDTRTFSTKDGRLLSDIIMRTLTDDAKKLQEKVMVAHLQARVFKGTRTGQKLMRILETVLGGLI